MKYSGQYISSNKTDGLLKWAYTVLLFFIMISFFAPLIANDKPIRVKTSNKTIYPILSSKSYKSTCNKEDCKILRTPIPFSAQTIDVRAMHAAPGSLGGEELQYTHLLGTDGLGRDVTAALIYGSRTALWISVLAALLAFFIGCVYGLLIGYYGHDRVLVTYRQWICSIVILLLTGYGLLVISHLNQATILSDTNGAFLYMGMALLVSSFFYYSRNMLSKGKAIPVNLDGIGMRVVDLIKALPALFIVLFALQLVEQKRIYYLIILIAFLLWAGFARHARAEVWRMRSRASVQAALLAGKNDLWIFRHEILPFIVRPLFVSLAFSVAGAILLEATLSFLGIGMPVDHVSWGTLINDARNHNSSWWLLVFPGLCMLSLIWAIQHIGRSIESRLQYGNQLLSIDEKRS